MAAIIDPQGNPTAVLDDALKPTSTTVATPSTAVPAAPAVAATSYNPTTLAQTTPWSINSNQTVAGQLPGIIDQNSALGQQVTTQAKESYANRGLLNSSMATTGAQSALLANATPIAAADATAYQKSAAYNADQANQSNDKNALAINAANQFNAGQANAVQSSQINNENRLQIQALDSANKLQIQGLQNKNSQLLSSNTQAASVFQNAVSALNNIANSSSMDASTKTEQSRQIYANLQSQLRVFSATANLDLPGILGVNPYGADTPAAPGTPAPGMPAPGVPAPAAPTPYLGSNTPEGNS